MSGLQSRIISDAIANDGFHMPLIIRHIADHYSELKHLKPDWGPNDYLVFTGGIAFSPAFFKPRLAISVDPI